MCKIMNSLPLPYLFVIFVTLVAASISSGQVAVELAPAPKTGVAIEPLKGQAQLQEAFTNHTGSMLAIKYGGMKFLLKPGPMLEW